MLDFLYRRPKQVYLLLVAALALGWYAYSKLSVALFPESSRPAMTVGIPYGRYTQEGFLHQYGSKFEYELKSIDTRYCTTQRVEAEYRAKDVSYNIEFSWNDNSQECKHEVEQKLAQAKGMMPKEIADNAWSWVAHGNTGFLFLQFHSLKHRSQDLYALLDSLLVPKLGQIKEAQNPWLSNPEQMEIRIEADPLRLAGLGITALDIRNSVATALRDYGAGELRFGSERHHLTIEALAIKPSDLELVPIVLDDDKKVYLGEIAKIENKASSRYGGVFKLNGVQAVSLYVKPAPGENIRDMCSKVFATIDQTLIENNLANDVSLAVVVNPAAYIDSATTNVMREVWLSSFIAVLVLFLFLGSFMGTFTTLLEIPTSIVLSFILMKIFDVKINLISLGGLALSVGMNVDASIVIIDAIMKRIGSQKLSQSELLLAVKEAVSEVWVALIVSTLISLVVFVPLAFTSALTEAILGDLAKAVIFSHGLSLVIALILVPTVRLHLAPYFVKSDQDVKKNRWLLILDRGYAAYAQLVTRFIQNPKRQAIVYAGLTILLGASFYWLPSKLKREIVGKPDTDLISVLIDDEKSALVSTMEDNTALMERRIREAIGDEVDFIFTEIQQPTFGFMAVKLKEKKDIAAHIDTILKLKDSSDAFRITAHPWNPSELPIPDPPDVDIHIRAVDQMAGQKITNHVRANILEAGLIEDIHSSSSFDPLDYKLVFYPRSDLFATKALGLPTMSDLSQILALTREGFEIDRIAVGRKTQGVILSYPSNCVESESDLAGFPVRVGNTIVPLASLGDIAKVVEANDLMRINGLETIKLSGRFRDDEKRDEKSRLAKLETLVEDFQKDIGSLATNVSVVWTDAKLELSSALSELGLAIAISAGLIFVILYLQFSSVVHALIIMLAIPFGALGVVLSLYVFGSTLSLNSGLGMILLGGIACGNSILLVEKILVLHEAGASALSAIEQSVRLRIRPILITSLVTIMGMMPIAMGWGEGGKVLQPLGIAVCGGLWVSLICTLFVIPGLEYRYLVRKENV